MSKTAPAPFSIREFFAGKGVLLTGSTGFLAKAVVEKLLRDLPEVRQIYLLIRPRVKADGSRIDPRERLREEILRNSAFRRLREQLGERFESYCESKITCVPGDLTREHLGMTAEAFEDLAKNVQVVMNSAATVVFDERLDLALDLNTLGPQRLLELARKSGGVYVHISTAYVSGKRTGLVPERLVDPLEQIDAQLPAGVERPKKFDVKEEIARLSELAKTVRADCEKQLKLNNIALESDAGIAQLRTALVSAGMRRAQSLGWNDTYTYTKYLGEQLIKLNRGDIPTVIVRPSIIESSLSEPEPGWLDGLRMADPIIIGFGKGRLADFPANQNVVLDIIPADLVVNGILAGAAHIAKTGGLDLFVVASSSENPLVFRSLYDYVRDYFQKHPMTDRAGKPVPVPRWHFPTVDQYRRRMRNRYLRPVRAANLLLNSPMPTLPGTRKMRARLRNLNTTLEQLLYYVDIYGPYVNLQCRFETAHGREIMEMLSPDERERFDFDARKIRWRNYLQDVHIPGLKRNILRMEAPPRAGAGEGHLLDEEAEAARKRSGAQASSTASPAIRGVPQTIVELCARGAERYGKKSLAEIRRAAPGGGWNVTRISYAEMYQRSVALARTLTARLDLHHGDRVALIAENGPEWVLGYLAICQACCTAVPLDRMMPPKDAVKLMNLVEAKAAIVSPAIMASAPDAFSPAHGAPPCLNPLADFQPHSGHHWPYPEASIGDRPLREPAPEMLASILFTSGTTYEPKGVMLSHANLIANALATAEILEPMESDRFLSVLPLHHALEFTGGFTIPMYGGSTIFYIESHKEVADTMKLAEITVAVGVPRLFQSFMDRIKERMAAAGTGARIKASIGRTVASTWELAGSTTARRRIFKQIHEAMGGRLRLFISGGAALDPEIFNFFKNFGITIAEGYGLTETSPVLAVNPLSAPRAGTVGPPVPGVEIRIDAPNSEGIGEVLGRGPSIMQGYWRNPAATERAFENGWFKTGDLGRIDRDGYLHITGRLKDVIVTPAGKNVYPDEVEAALHTVPGVKAICVIGMPARSGMGEEVMAVIVLDENASAEKVRAAIEQACRDLPSHQRVSRIEFQTDDLPKTSTLKVQRTKVRERYLGNRKSNGADAPATAGTHLPIETSKRGEAGDSRFTDSGIFTGIARAIAEVAPRIAAADVTPDQKLQMDLGIDSIGRVDLLQKLELYFEITIPQESEGRLFTVRDVITIVQDARKSSGNAGKSGHALTLLDRSPEKTDGIQHGMRRTISKSILQSVFSTSASVFMNTYLAIDCTGLEHVPRNGAYILAANHCSHLDSLAIREVLGQRASRLHVMGAKDYFFNTRLKSWFFQTFLNVLPFDREEKVSESLNACKTVLDSGRAILLFPEGTRSVTGELQAFKPGIGVLGIELDVPVLPVYLRGTFESLPKGKSLPRPTRLEVRIGAPISFESLKKEKGKMPPSDLYRKAAALLRARLETLSNLPLN
jgi:long-chain acyl-CoA synthetase